MASPSRRSCCSRYTWVHCSQERTYSGFISIVQITGMQKYRERRYGASIQWFVRAGHPVHPCQHLACVAIRAGYPDVLSCQIQGRLAQVANRLVDDFYQGSVINAEEVTAVVEQLDKDFIFTDRLIFLSKVRDLKRYQEVLSRVHSELCSLTPAFDCPNSKGTGVRCRP